MRIGKLVVFVLAGIGQLFAAPQAELVVQIGQTTVSSVSFSPDGGQVLTGGDNVALLWDTATGQEIRAFIGHSANVTASVFSPSGKLVLTASYDGTAKVWDAASGKEIRRIQCDCAFNSATFSPDGQHILTGDSHGIVRLWDTESGKQILQMKAADSSAAVLPTPVAFSPDGKVILAATRKLAQLWDTSTGQELRRFEGHTFFINSVAFSPDGRLVLTGSNDHTARLWDVVTGKEIRRFEEPGRASERAILSVAFSPDGQAVLTGSEDRNARLWDISTGQQILVLPASGNKLKLDAQGRVSGMEATPGHLSRVTGVAFSKNGRLLLTGEGARTVRLWDAGSGRQLREFQGNVTEAAAVPSLAFSPDGHELWTNGPRRWNLKTGSLVFQPEDSKVDLPVALSSDGTKVAVSLAEHLFLFDSITQKKILDFTPLDRGTDRVTWGGEIGEVPHDAPTDISTIIFSPTGGQLLTIGRTFIGDDDVRLWDTSTGKELSKLSSDIREFGPTGLPSSFVRSTVFSPDGREVLQAGSDKIVRLWNAVTGKLIRTFEPRYRPAKVGAPGDEAVASFNFNSRIESFAVAFSPDGTKILTGNEDGVRVWDKVAGKEISHWGIGAFIPIEVGAFTPDGSKILIALENKLLLLDATSRREIFHSVDYSAPVKSMSFSPQGGFVASAHEDGTIRFWSLATDQLQLVATLVSFSTGGWTVFDPQGRFDTDLLDGQAPLHWIVSDEPFRPLPLEIFMRQYYTPRLLARLLSGEKLPAVPSIAALNRVQPRVEPPVVEAEPGKPGVVRVRVRVAAQASGKKQSGAQDLRVFRNGQMVKFKQGLLRDGEYVFDDIRLPHQPSVEFSAYAFNTDLVKGETARTVWKAKVEPAKAQPRTFLMNIGVNRIHASGCDLQYAASDAVNLSQILESRLPAVTKKLLVSDDARPLGATKESIRSAIAEISRQAIPDDIFIMSFSGHGFTDKNGQFYIFPSDLNGSCERLDDEHTLASAISSDELSEWLRPLDAGEMVMILDACYSAASVESGEFKPGPMGSKGLGQLAYDKRIRILAASQSTQAAAETPWLKMGLLTYSLVKDGLEAKWADWQPADGKIWLREWLSYGVMRVPDLYKALRDNKADEFRNAGSRGWKLVGRANDYEHPSLQTPSLFDFTDKENQGIPLQQ